MSRKIFLLSTIPGGASSGSSDFPVGFLGCLPRSSSTCCTPTFAVMFMFNSSIASVIRPSFAKISAFFSALNSLLSLVSSPLGIGFCLASHIAIQSPHRNRVHFLFSSLTWFLPPLESAMTVDSKTISSTAPLSWISSTVEAHAS